MGLQQKGILVSDESYMIIVAVLHWLQYIIESDDKIGYNNHIHIEADWHLHLIYFIHFYPATLKHHEVPQVSQRPCGSSFSRF